MTNAAAPVGPRPAHDAERYALTASRFHASRRRRIAIGRWCALLLALPLLALAGRARADCTSGFSPSAVTFTAPATIMLPNSTPPRTVLWTSPSASAPNAPTLDCIGTVGGIDGPSTVGYDTMFPTNVLGLSWRILNSDAALGAYSDEPVGTGKVGPFLLQLVVTGPFAAGSTFDGSLGQWNVDTCNNVKAKDNGCAGNSGKLSTVVTFSTNSVVFVAPACTVAVDPITVTLPTVWISNFKGAGSTTGQKAFDVQLTCAADAHLFITLSTASPAAGLASSGVIKPTTGSSFANDVGVQILDRNETPVAFGTPVDAGITTDGAVNVPFYARYYQTGSSVSGGKVKATATYTLTYQ